MKFLSTAIVLFASTALATNHGAWNEGQIASAPTPTPVGNAPPSGNEAPKSDHDQPAPVENQPPSGTPPPVQLDVQPPNEGAKTHTVIVGGDAGLVYTPQHIQAEIGDIVHFIFQKQNHSVTQSSFDKPCNRLESGQDSGLLANANDTVVPAPTWEYTVTEKEPTWWYCKQRTGTHCGKGMVFAINPNKEKTFDKFREVAIKINGTDGTPPPDPTVTNPASTVTLIGDGEAPPTDAPPPPPQQTGEVPPYVAPGWNEKGDPNACNCACFCGVGTFPQGDGWGHYGGVGGSLSSPWKA